MNPLMPYMLFIKIGLVVLLIGACVWKYEATIHSAEKRGYAQAMAEVVKRDNAALQAANTKLKAAEERVLALERKSAQDVASISQKYEQEKSKNDAITQKNIAAVRAGTLRLRDPGSIVANAGSGSASSQTSATACRPDAGASSQLSTAATEFLLGIASEADQLAQQLTAVQEIIKKDREVCK